MFVFVSLITSVTYLALIQPCCVCWRRCLKTAGHFLQSLNFHTELSASVTVEWLPRHRNYLATISDRATMLTKHFNVMCLVVSTTIQWGNCWRCPTASAALVKDKISNITKKSTAIKMEDKHR